ncbi:unnamed protein product [Albugo candida]|uniref:non-specific serine/threonine protein kinase n=1 Tax=Albugo candida TaxID=65357 RepID=A0A024G651_9STRA|nr:unnamed protein product [Albugo candida]|eukprot:CCI42330.1 unnamed protein product [Albugo candida]
MAAVFRKGKYMPLSETNVSPTFVTSYDGQQIITGADRDREIRYTMGNYLGGGIAGVVYEAFDRKEHQHVAIKILNPVGYKLLNPAVLRRGEIIKHGVPVVGNVRNMTLENVYWVKVANRTDLIACYVDHTQHTHYHTHLPTNTSIVLELKELTLEMCVGLWRFDIIEQVIEEECDEMEIVEETHEVPQTLVSTVTSASGISLLSNNNPSNPANENVPYYYQNVLITESHERIRSTKFSAGGKKPLTTHMDEMKTNEECFHTCKAANSSGTSMAASIAAGTGGNPCSLAVPHRFETKEQYHQLHCHRHDSIDLLRNKNRAALKCKIPAMPAKYKAFLLNRKSIYREIAHMHKLTGNSVSGQITHGGHENVLKLFDVLELIQPSKSTIFLVLELAYGGELFDRIKGDQGVEELIARRYFRQLLSGVLFCHQLGIVHRDLKPENLLLSDSDVLKIADFGLSAHFIAAVSNRVVQEQPQSVQDLHGSLSTQRRSSPEDDDRFTSTTNAILNASSSSTLSMPAAEFRRLNSVVGSPHYVAPEVLQNARYGYDGRKADMWSIGVILYGLLVGSLPFGKELQSCPRYLKFCDWIRSLPADAHTGKLLYEPEVYQQPSPVPNDDHIEGTRTSRKHTLVHPNCNNDIHRQYGLSIKANLNVGGLHLSNHSLPPLNNKHSPINSSGSNPTMGFPRSIAYPSWLFPRRLSTEGIFLLSCLLHPDPVKRYSCEDASKSFWVQLPVL